MKTGEYVHVFYSTDPMNQEPIRVEVETDEADCQLNLGFREAAVLIESLQTSLREAAVVQHEAFRICH